MLILSFNPQTIFSPLMSNLKWTPNLIMDYASSSFQIKAVEAINVSFNSHPRRMQMIVKNSSSTVTKDTTEFLCNLGDGNYNFCCS